VRILPAAAMLLVWAESTPFRAADPGAAPPLVGIDHVPIAVRSLEDAVETYRGLGFAIKPGRPHASGIRNQHVKFRDGTEIELISPSGSRDELNQRYRRHLEMGGGPAFLALYAPSLDLVSSRLAAVGLEHRRGDGILTLSAASPIGYIFFGRRNASPTDRPEHFQHPNTAESLVAVWLAGGSLGDERHLLEQLGAWPSGSRLFHPLERSADVFPVIDGEIYLVPGLSRSAVIRPIVGLTVQVRNLAVARERVRRILKPWVGRGSGDDAQSELRPWRDIFETDGSLFLPPQRTHGVRLELREHTRERPGG
jgi:catechol 2,3-dioxygenase-like lactoylglutathione lyase family enzyme